MSNPKRGDGRRQKPGPSQRENPSSPKAFLLYGVHAVRAALLNSRRKARRLLVAPLGLEKLGDVWRVRGLTPHEMSPAELSKLLPEGAVHQGVALEVLPLPEISLEDYLAQGEARPLVLLDQVTDPHNVGAILRSAAAFGAGAVILPRDHAPQESAVMAKASSGGIEIVPLIHVTNLSQCMETLKKNGYWCAGLDGEAKQVISQAKLGAKTALVLGAEGAGLRRLTAERCDLLVRLPIAAQMESLNVSNAAAVALYAIAEKG